jgi:hypothetical protein
MAAQAIGTSGIRAALGYLQGETFMMLHKHCYDSPNDTINWDGHVMLKEGDRLVGRFYNHQQGERLDVWAMGYKIILPTPPR